MPRCEVGEHCSVDAGIPRTRPIRSSGPQRSRRRFSVYQHVPSPWKSRARAGSAPRPKPPARWAGREPHRRSSRGLRPDRPRTPMIASCSPAARGPAAPAGRISALAGRWGDAASILRPLILNAGGEHGRDQKPGERTASSARMPCSPRRRGPNTFSNPPAAIGGGRYGRPRAVRSRCHDRVDAGWRAAGPWLFHGARVTKGARVHGFRSARSLTSREARRPGGAIRSPRLAVLTTTAPTWGRGRA